ncbi:MAG TPA: hypothetical protein PK900_09335 [Spirochaetota bacterium]|nr:hypothetical protein [Spirochaetota bacterium]
MFIKIKKTAILSLFFVLLLSCDMVIKDFSENTSDNSIKNTKISASTTTLRPSSTTETTIILSETTITTIISTTTTTVDYRLQSLLINEWGDSSISNMDYIEIKHFGTDESIINNMNFSIRYGELNATRVYLAYYVTDSQINNKLPTSGGVAIKPGEIFLIVDKDVSDSNLESIRNLNNYRGKIFISTEPTLIGTGDRLSSNFALLADQNGNCWGKTPPPKVFSSQVGVSGYSYLARDYTNKIGDTEDPAFWGNGPASRQSAGIENAAFDDTISPSTTISSTTTIPAITTILPPTSSTTTVLPSTTIPSTTTVLSSTTTISSSTTVLSTTTTIPPTTTTPSTTTTTLSNTNDLRNLLINEWFDGGTNEDYIEIKNFGTRDVVIDDTNFKVVFGSNQATVATLHSFLAEYEDNPANKIPTSNGTVIKSGEIFLIVDSDVSMDNILTIRNWNNFTGKIFLSNEKNLIGHNDRLSDNYAFLEDIFANKWSITPDPAVFKENVGYSTCSYIIRNFDIYLDSSEDPASWRNSTARRRTAGVDNYFE